MNRDEEKSKNTEEVARMEGLTQELLFDGLAASSDYVYLFKTDLENNYSIWSGNAISYFGLPEDYNKRMLEVWLSHIHPDDLDDYVEKFNELIEGKIKVHNCQYRARNSIGEYVWLHCVGSILYNEEGKGFFVGIITRLNVTGMYDPITNCLSIPQFHAAIVEEPKTMILFGFDGFRNIINSIGFSEGNRILKLFGDILKKRFGKDNVFRMPGDELLVIPELSCKDNLEYFFDELLKEFKSSCLNNGFQISMGFSAGAADYYPGKETKDDALKKLEHSLAHSKKIGKETFTIYTPSIGEQHIRLNKLKYALSNAIKNDFKGFSVVFQPIVDCEAKRMDGAECLLRFYDEELGSVSPVEFIPILEDNGKIKQVGKWVCREAIAQKAEWDKKGYHLNISFNVSLKQLQSRELVDYILETIKEYNVASNQIVVELTESCQMDDARFLNALLMPLREAGVNVLLDDFGMEQSSFTLVQQLPITGVKIDHSFVRVMADADDPKKNKINKAIVSSIIYMCKQIDLQIVVEGVENEVVEGLVADLDAKFMQGYYYSRPASANQIEESWLKNQ